ncbi:MAG TPA: PaaI family thioesterase [Candidatus Eisenbacteria bacterium]|nr:PaaI family thioesterase [Candidatus Eisenbacteria bacterium]
MADRDAFPPCPYARFVGMEVARVGDDYACVRLPRSHDTANRNGSLHGGVTASLLDVAGMLAAQSAPGGTAPAGSTIDLAVHYLAPAVDEGVVAESHVTRRGREIVFVETHVTSDGGTPIARGVGVVRLGAPAESEPPPSAPACPIGPETQLLPRQSGSAFTARLGVFIATVAPGHTVFVLPIRPELCDATGRLHEGALAALVDSAGGAAAWSVHGWDPRGRAATIGMHLCFDRTPDDEDVVVEARTTWRAAGVFLNTVTLTGRRTGRAVATGSVTYRIVRPEP